LDGHRDWSMFDFQTYHKLVKTTPKPRATKKSSGDDCAPLGDEFTADVAETGREEVALGVAEMTDDAMVVAVVRGAARLSVEACVAARIDDCEAGSRRC